MSYSFAKENANAPTTRKTQYFEMFGTAHLPGRLVCQHDTDRCAVEPRLHASAGRRETAYKWELYDLTKDWTQNHDFPRNTREVEGDAKALHG